MESEKLPIWVWVIVVLALVWSILTNLIFGVFLFVIQIAIGYKCKEWAEKLGKNQTHGFLFGFLFGLVGLSIYYFSNRDKIKSLKEEKKELTNEQKKKIKEAKKKDSNDFVRMIKVVGVLVVLALIYFLVRWLL